MKRHFKTTLCGLLFIFLVAGCKKMEDKYRQFVENGEIIYIGRADSVQIRGGDHRLEISWLLLSDPKVDSYKLYWNNRQDSIVSKVTKTAFVDTVRVLLDNMPEGLHHFEIFMYDNLGNSSVPVVVSGRSYGNQYSSYLVNRIFKEPKTLSGIGLQLNWAPAENELLFSEVQYENTEGVTVQHIVDRRAELDTLKLFPVGGVLRLSSAYKPDSLALDTFYSRIEEFKPL